MLYHHPRHKNFVDVAMAFILVGVFIAAYGGVAWLWNWYSQTYTITLPVCKIIGGLIITALGYIMLELELMREKQ